MSHRAKLLILDEPTAGLDVVAREELLDLLRAYMEEDEGRAVLISSHISSDLEGLCDDIYMIHQGQIVLHQDTDVLLGQYGLLKATAEQYGALDKQYLLRVKREPYGYSCLTDQKQFYQENYPQLAVENGSIDRVMAMMIQGRMYDEGIAFERLEAAEKPAEFVRCRGGFCSVLLYDGSESGVCGGLCDLCVRHDCIEHSHL